MGEGVYTCTRLRHLGRACNSLGGPVTCYLINRFSWRFGEAPANAPPVGETVAEAPSEVENKLFGCISEL